MVLPTRDPVPLHKPHPAVTVANLPVRVTPVPSIPPPPPVENRESFFNRLRPVLAPSALMDVEVAYALAKHCA